jgi:anti-sigma B factor antagonist
MLEIKHEVIRDVLVINLIGRLDSSTSRLLVERMISEELSTNPRIVFNCKDLNYISSEGLRITLMTAKKAKSLGGALTLCEMNAFVIEVMTISGFQELLGAHANVDLAINAIS